MRKLITLSTLLFICLALTSCATSRPEDKFLGAWKGTHEDETYLVEFLEKDIVIIKGEGETNAGTWTLDADGNARLVGPDTEDKAVATPTKDGRLIIRADETTAVVFQRVPKQ
jgi:hypothetical protein